MDNPLNPYPIPGFHFSVDFLMTPQSITDNRFSEVSGLSVDLETEDFKEGGENRFVHKLPTRTKYSEITLKRAMSLHSGVVKWCQQAVEEFKFRPTNLIISLLNEKHLPVASWFVVKAYPVQWSISEFKAEESALVVESIKLNYNYFRKIAI